MSSLAPNVQRSTENENAEKLLDEKTGSPRLVETSGEPSRVDNSNSAVELTMAECPVVLLCGHEDEVCSHSLFHERHLVN